MGSRINIWKNIILNFSVSNLKCLSPLGRLGNLYEICQLYLMKFYVSNITKFEIKIYFHELILSIRILVVAF